MIISLRNLGWIIAGSLALTAMGCGDGNGASSTKTPEEMQSFSHADMSKAPPDVQKQIEAARKGSGPPPGVSQKKP